MEDRNMEQRVWQRVRAAGEEAPRSDLRQLQREAMELAAIYQGIASRLTGKQQEQVQRLYGGEKANSSALVGIGVLSRQGGEVLKLWQPGKEDVKLQLQRCYHRTRRCMTEYLARSAEAEYGVVFERLAKREGEHCMMIAELLGSLG